MYGYEAINGVDLMSDSCHRSSEMKKKRTGYLVIILIIILVIVGVIVVTRIVEQKHLSAAAIINCPTFDTQEYTAGTALSGRDLTMLLSEGLDAHYNIRYDYWLENVNFTDLVADSFPAPYAVLLKTAQDGQTVFCRPEGFEIADSLSEAKTLVYIEQSGPYHSGSYYCSYQPYVFTLSGEYFMSGETGVRLIGNTVQEGIAKSIESFGVVEPRSDNPLERYVANYQRIKAYDFMAMIESAQPAEDETAIEYQVNMSDKDGWYVIPCYDLTEKTWRQGEFEINGDPPLRIMTCEETGWTPIQGTYAKIGTAYIQTLRIRVYDCEAGIYIEFPWHDDTSARSNVSGSRLASSPPYVYCPAK